MNDNVEQDKKTLDTSLLSTLAIDINKAEKLDSISDQILKKNVVEFLEQGFLIIPSAVDTNLCDNLREKVESGFGGKALCSYWDIDGIKKTEPFKPSFSNKQECKILDTHEYDQDARDAIFSPQIRDILEVIFGDIPVAFQSLAFIRGSEQPVHDDRTFVVVDPPNNFIASWIALEDVRPGSGALCYYPFSHKLEPHIFRSGSLSKYEANELLDYSAQLAQKTQNYNLEVEEFYPKKGDVLLWHSALLHGGTVIKDKEITRYSFVTHYCPYKSKPSYSKIATP